MRYIGVVGPLAQWVERGADNAYAMLVGSNLTRTKKNNKLLQWNDQKACQDSFDSLQIIFTIFHVSFPADEKLLR